MDLPRARERSRDKIWQWSLQRIAPLLRRDWRGREALRSRVGKLISFAEQAKINHSWAL